MKIDNTIKTIKAAVSVLRASRDVISVRCQDDEHLSFAAERFASGEAQLLRIGIGVRPAGRWTDVLTLHIEMAPVGAGPNRKVRAKVQMSHSAGGMEHNDSVVAYTHFSAALQLLLAIAATLRAAMHADGPVDTNR